MKKTFMLPFVLSLLFSFLFLAIPVDLVAANPPIHFIVFPTIIIAADGSVTPPTAPIIRNGRTYTLTADIKYALVIACNNIVFDGAGHSINITQGSNSGLTMEGVRSVTVKNLKIFGGYTSSVKMDCSNCVITNLKADHWININGAYSHNNIITDSEVSINLEGSLWGSPKSGVSFSGFRGMHVIQSTSYIGPSGNLIKRNNISSLYSLNSGSNMFIQNNFLGGESAFREIYDNQIWDNGLYGNYWSDYSAKCPNASEVGNTGIGNTPYAVKGIVDHFPMLYPWGTPNLMVLEAENTTNTQDYPLNFTIDKPSLWMGYSLDGETNVTLTGNTTLAGLAPGLHNLVVYATDIYGVDGASQTVFFTVIEPFPVAWVIAVSFISIVGVAVCLFYYRKRRAYPSV
ncbi:MAG: hypothetical protein NWE92_00485 [Candidatus Bathyarchaeota archaeon]|nr:hypothetical protein [Candidatus Bathyarchaeota archaeon]